LFGQNALEFIEEVTAGVDAPACTFRGCQQFFGYLAEQGFRHIDIHGS
jgi:hypothetical protein